MYDIRTLAIHACVKQPEMVSFIHKSHTKDISVTLHPAFIQQRTAKSFITQSTIVAAQIHFIVGMASKEAS